ncbi:HD domain-containing protein [bacterium]|nr:HD domain-containing protein [bacterium]
MTQNNSANKTVSLNDLTSQMVIQSYSGFPGKFRSMDKATSEWVKHNFKGTSIVAEREGKQLEFPVENLNEGDTLLRIQKFPQTLERLLIVNDKLINELKSRGFTKFEVKIVNKPTNAVQEKRKNSVQKAEKLIQQVKESIEVRDKASFAVESLMDNGRKGKANTKEIISFVDNIITNSSADAITAIASLKQSDQTYAHCVDVGAIFQVVYQKLIENMKVKNVFKDGREVLLSSFMHDFGKSKVPKEILDSTVRFERDSKEMQMMQNHPVYGAELLANMNMPSYIIDMAHFHHIKMDTSMASSYPDSIKWDDVRLEARLIAIIDIYQALVGKRSYKKSWAPPAAMKFIDNLAGVEYDLDIWNEFMKIMGRYPKGSAVELSDGSQAFVVSVPEKDLSRPSVVIVRNASGEDLKHHTLVDLEVEKDLNISKEIDSFETFGDNVIELFASLQVI